MTDELSLQQQQVGNNAIPGLLGGAVIGGAGGAATSYWTNLGYKSKADYDKVIAMKEDTFKKQIENAGDNKGKWEKAQELVKKVKDAEAEYDKIVEEAKKSGVSLAELPDGNIKTTLKNAENAYNEALNAEKAKIPTGGKASFKLLTPDDARVIAKNTKEFNKYQTLFNAHMQALADARKNGAVAEKQALKDFKTLLYDKYSDIYLKGTTAKNKDVEKVVKEIKAEIQKIYPDVKLSDAELKARGIDVKNKKAKKEYLERLKDRVQASRETMLEQILGEKKEIEVFDSKGKLLKTRVSYANVEAYINADDKFSRAIRDINKSTVITPKQKADAIKVVTENRDNVVNRILMGIDHVGTLEGNIEKAVNSDATVKDTLTQIKRFLNSTGHEALKDASYQVSGGAALTADEIEAKALEALKKNKPNVVSDLEAAKKAAEEELTKLGKGGELTGDALTEAIKKKANGAGSKEEYTKKIAEEAKTEIEKMAKDLKIKNHWVTAAIGAGALALIGLGIGASQKKTAPVAEEA